MDNLIFQANGLKTSHKVLVVIPTILMVVIGIVFMFLSQSKHGTSQVTSYTLGSNTPEIGYIGGGDLFNDQAKAIILWIGIIFTIIGFINFCQKVSMKPYLYVYDNHIEGASVMYISVIKIKKNVYTTYDKITNVEFSKSNGIASDSIKIYTNYDHEPIIIALKDASQAYNAIMSKI